MLKISLIRIHNPGFRFNLNTYRRAINKFILFIFSCFCCCLFLKDGGYYNHSKGVRPEGKGRSKSRERSKS
uniref:Uncharacterized protein n=1 Tax=Siphoviridae sp. ctWhl2 TaxID=2827885 RepID=A0A8S5SBG6_9CAUD|nr:MAG TPA: hypothetical protein [Siphoviridae sp. ctWhl2]